MARLYQLDARDRVHLTSTRCQIDDRGGIQVGHAVRFLNPGWLEACRIFEGVCMLVTKILEGPLAFCQLPDGSEESFGLDTLVAI